jgi:hypothetical protein
MIVIHTDPLNDCLIAAGPRQHSDFGSELNGIHDHSQHSNISLILYTNLYKHSLRTSQETHYISATEPKRLILLGETVAVYCEKHT